MADAILLNRDHAKSSARPSGFLSRERTIASPSFNRWRVPPAALAIHLCIGLAYGFSVFWLSRAERAAIW